MDGESSAVWVIVSSQLGWLARFAVALGVFGFMTWWLRRVIGLDLTKNINNLEKLLHHAAEDKDVKMAIPITVLFVVGMFMVAFVIGGFVH